MKSIINPLSPARMGGWQWQATPTRVRAYHGTNAVESWYFHDGERQINVISAVEVAELGTAKQRVPHFHISISLWDGPAAVGPSRISSADAVWVLAQFGMDGGIEDNHVPDGKVRNFWRPVADNLVGIECECKDDEPAIALDKGDYVWRGVTR